MLKCECLLQQAHDLRVKAVLLLAAIACSTHTFLCCGVGGGLCQCWQQLLQVGIYEPKVCTTADIHACRRCC